MLSYDAIMPYKPPYNLDSEMLQKVAAITQLIGRIEGYQLLTSNLTLRRRNQIQSLRSSLAIEGNSLTEAQVTAILEGKRVLGPAREILEVQNAIRVYERLPALKPKIENDLLESHRLLIEGLIPDAGRYRNSGVGVVDGEKVIHIGPPHQRVPSLMGELFDYLVNYPEEIILQSCVFHYEFEFIHPFSDGNGRMGRLWQTVILKDRYPLMAYIPFENIIFARQSGYYRALSQSQSVGNSNPFIHFMLDALLTALQQVEDTVGAVQHPAGRLSAFKEYFKADTFTRKDYQMFHKTISSATASRDLQEGLTSGLLIKEGENNTTRYQFAPNS